MVVKALMVAATLHAPVGMPADAKLNFVNRTSPGVEIVKRETWELYLYSSLHYILLDLMDKLRAFDPDQKNPDEPVPDYDQEN